LFISKIVTVKDYWKSSDSKWLEKKNVVLEEACIYMIFVNWSFCKDNIRACQAFSLRFSKAAKKNLTFRSSVALDSLKSQLRNLLF